METHFSSLGLPATAVKLNSSSVNIPYSNLIQNLDAAIYVCDLSGRITFFNKAASRLWGRQPDVEKDLWCGSWKVSYPDGSPLSFDNCPIAVALRTGKPVRGVEIILERPDGERRNVMPHPDPIFDENGILTGVMNMLVDVTELRDREKKLIDIEAQLITVSGAVEEKVEERTKDLEEANDALIRSNRELEEVAYVASHDLQEPLRKIITYAKRLEQSSKDVLNENAKGYLSKINTSSLRMTKLIDSILNYSKLTGLEEEFIETDLNQVLKNVLNDLELRIEQTKAVIRSKRLPAIEAIPLQMHQLFNNIIANSLKFCHTALPCEIEISCRVLTAGEKTLQNFGADITAYEIIVRDNGIGFNQQFADDIFKIFQRLNEHEKFEGTGVGLAVCQKIVNIHRGNIFARSIPAKGTAIHIILPARRTTEK
jgi:signal transduction histidine kinase